MSPPRRRSTYKAPRNRRELTVAVLSSLGIIVAVAVLVWVLRPNKDSGTQPITTTPVVTTAPTSTTVAPTDTTPADTTPAETP
ncbi:MAG: hypothetical protein WD271_06595 [Acidimicrobiia bacterium]